MFEYARKALAKEYTKMLAIIIAGTTMILYVFFNYSIYLQHREIIEVFAYEESEEWHNALKSSMGVGLDEDDNNKDYNLFYYAYDINNKKVGQHSAPDNIENKLVKDVFNNLENNSIKFKLFFDGDMKSIVAYMAIKKDIYDDGVQIGTLYAGKNMTNYLNFIIKTLFCLMLLFLVIIKISALMARKMADKAMVPIINNFELQKNFTADASHELRTPLSVFLASVETIQRDKKNILSDFSQQVLKDLKDEIQYMKKITEKLLHLARIDNMKKGKDIQEKVLINELLPELYRKFQALADEKFIDITINMNEECWSFVNREQIFQVLKILLDNALKYTSEYGRIELILEQSADNKVRIIVKDNGIGIAPEDCHKIFERFFRVDKARLRKNGGSGLGLAIAYELVKKNNGTLTVQSQLDKGSSFILELPKIK
jgi:two-component system sensor histidine kinase CiaH